MQEWFNHFNKVLNPEGKGDRTYESRPREEVVVEVEDLDKQITMEELNRALNKLKAKKAAGDDGIIPEFLKNASSELKEFMIKLFNNLYDNGVFPSEWSSSIIVPIFKKGDRMDPSNYRGTSLSNILSKVYTSILTDRLYSWTENEGKLFEEQAGFRKGHSTVDHIFALSQLVSNCLYGNRRKKVYCAFIDFQKAFDTVDRARLWEVLVKIGVSTKFITTLKAMYSTVNARVRVGNEFSEPIECPAGVKQGCKLSPILFALLINEVAKQVKTICRGGYQFLPDTEIIRMLLFADDIALLSLTPANLQHAIDVLEVTASQMGLKINIQKTKVMVFRKGGFLGKSERFSLAGTNLEVVNNYNYLGFLMTTKLSTDTALAQYVGKAKSKVYTILRTLKSLGKVDIKTFFKLFDSQVTSALMYASEVWGLIPYEAVESVHTFACKKLLGVRRQTPNCLVYGETGRFPLCIESKIRSVKYWHKIINMEPDRLPRIAYEREFQENKKENNWVRNIKNLLEQTGFGYIWELGHATQINSFSKQLKQRLRDMYIQCWQYICDNSGKFTQYRAMKVDFGFEPYLGQINVAKFRFAYTRLRIAASYLHINRRLIRRNPVVKCPFCRETENEIHFLLYCQVYKELRTKYINKHFPNHNATSLAQLLNNDKKEIILDVAMYAYEAFDLRSKKLREMKVQKRINQQKRN